MKVCITKDPQGQFSVSVESEEPTQPDPSASAAPGNPTAPQDPNSPPPSAPESGEDTNAQPAKSLQEALNMAGRLLSQPDPNAGPSAFDQGVAAVLPKKPGMM